MHPRTLLLAPLLGASALAADPPAAIPAPFPGSRYERMVQEAPFAVATAAQPVVAMPSFAADLYVTGVARIGDQDLVTISSRDKTRRFSLFSGDTSENAEGIEIIKVDWSENVGGSKVSVKKGSEFGTLSFDQAELARPLAPDAPIARPPRTNVPVPTAAPPAATGGGPQPPVRVRRRLPVIPGPR